MTATAPKPRWTFYMLWPNVAVVVVMSIVVVSQPQMPSARELGRALAYSLIYANLTGLLGYLFVEVVAEKLGLRKFPVLFAACIVVVIPLGTLLVQVLALALGFEFRQYFWTRYFHMLRVAMPLAVLFGLAAAIHGTLRGRVQLTEEKLREKELAEQRAQKLAAEARLQSLESRIHPHFLFNTLNSISSLIAVNPSRAEQTVGRLATLLRASLDNSSQPLIPLHQELAMVESYLEIEKTRFGQKLCASINAPAELLNAMVPPMSVQGLVENAVKHGISRQTSGGEVVIAAAAQDGNLRIEVRDTGPGFDLTAVHAGHGLDNLVQRLDALYGPKASLNVLHRDGYSVVEMVLPQS